MRYRREILCAKSSMREREREVAAKFSMLLKMWKCMRAHLLCRRLSWMHPSWGSRSSLDPRWPRRMCRREFRTGGSWWRLGSQIEIFLWYTDRGCVMAVAMLWKFTKQSTKQRGSASIDATRLPLATQSEIISIRLPAHYDLFMHRITV